MISCHSYLMRNDPNFVELSLTSPVCAFFSKNAIFFGSPDHTPNPAGRVVVSKHGAIEQYTLFGGNFAHPMGAFSYNHSQTSSMKAGRYCSIGNGLRVMGERHPMEWATTSNITYCFRPEWNKPHFMRAHAELMEGQWRPLPPPGERPHADDPILGHDVWVAETVVLARGITIGTGAVVGVNSVVTKDVPPYMIVAGNPARPIRQRFGDAICERLLASRWWELHPDVLFKFNVREPDCFLDNVDAARSSTGLCPVRGFSWEDILRGIGENATDDFGCRDK